MNDDNFDDLEIIDGDVPLSFSIIKKINELPIAAWLVLINVLVFLTIHGANILIEENFILLRFAKLTKAISIGGEYYRLFTPIFMHESITHLLFNCMAIIILGKPVEQIFGKKKFLIIFIVAGLFGNLSSFIFSYSLSIGASGGVFGFFGVHIYLYIKNRETYLKVFGKDIFQLLIINVIIGFAVPNIDFFAHFGGIVGGFLACFSLGLTHKMNFNKNLIAFSFITGLLFIGPFTYFNNEYITYDEYLNTAIDEFNESIKTNDLDEMKRIKTSIMENNVYFPPRPDTDYYLEQIDEIIEDLEN